MPTPFQIEDALRRSGVGNVPLPPPVPASAPSQAGFAKAWSPEDRKRQAEKLAEVLRKRGG